jgi:hypothetical protein
MSITSPRVRPSPNDRRVGIRIRTFEACSGFTFVTAHRIAQQPKAAFVAGLRPSQLLGRAACQLPDQSTIIRVRPSLTGSSRPWGARSIASFGDVPATSALPLPSLIIGLHALASEPSRQRHDRLETVGDIAEVPDFPQAAGRPLRRTLRPLDPISGPTKGQAIWCSRFWTLIADAGCADRTTD